MAVVQRGFSAMTFDEALRECLQEDDFAMSKGLCVWAAQADSKNIWIHMEYPDGSLYSRKVLLATFKQKLVQ